jgi:hypothetical protein
MAVKRETSIFLTMHSYFLVAFYVGYTSSLRKHCGIRDGGRDITSVVGGSALPEYHDCGDAMDLTAMTDCPTNSEFDGLQSTTIDLDEKRKQKLYLANKRGCKSTCNRVSSTC